MRIVAQLEQPSTDRPEVPERGLVTRRQFRNVGRMLRTLRVAGLVPVEAAAVAAQATPARIRAIERGEDLPNFFEADSLIKPYLLCASCFSRHLRAAAARDGAAEAAGVALLSLLQADEGDGPRSGESVGESDSPSDKV